jgi:hypothetical protein
MSATLSGGIPLAANTFTDSGVTASEDCLIQNTSGNTIKLVISETEPASGFVGAHEILPNGVWMRTDTSNTPLLQGKIWLESRYAAVIPITK